MSQAPRMDNEDAAGAAATGSTATGSTATGSIATGAAATAAAAMAAKQAGAAPPLPSSAPLAGHGAAGSVPPGDAQLHPAGSENCLPPGTRLADYEIVRVLGEGGFGIVYLAFDHALHRHVAIKEYMPSALAMRGADLGVSLRAERHQDTYRLGLKSFINEARFLAQFDHPALVKVHRYWEQNRTAYTAMQYYQGRTVKQIVADTPQLVDQAWCLRLLGNILQALDMLHGAQIVHRDVSPDNIIVQSNGDAVLLDFGSARQVIGDMTRGLTVILKPGYAPVEQYAGDASLEQGPYTDLYALAAVMLFAITGKAPASSIARMIQDPLLPLAGQALPGYSLPFLAAIDNGVAVLAQDRPQTVDAFRASLGIAAPPSRGSAAPGLPAPRSVRDGGAGAGDAVAGGSGSSDSADAVATARMPVGAGSTMPAPLTTPLTTPLSAPGLTEQPAAPARRWPLFAAGAALVLLAAYGIGTLLRDGGDDTIMMLHQQPPPRAVSAAAASALASAMTADSLSTPAPSAADPASSLDPQESLWVQPGMPTSTSASGARATTPASLNAAGAVVTFNIKPWGTVFVDGRERGVSPPLKRLTLAPGTHQLRLVNPAFAERLLTIEVGSGRPLAVEHNFARAAAGQRGQ